MLFSSSFLDLAEVELYGSRPAENLYRHPDLVLVVVHLLDHAVEVVEWAVGDAHHLAGLEQHLGPRLIDALLDPVQYCIGFVFRDRRRTVAAAADETENFRNLLDEMPSLVVHLHLHEHVAGKEFALAFASLSFAHFHDFLGRHQNLAELAFEPVTLDALL